MTEGDRYLMKISYSIRYSGASCSQKTDHTVSVSASSPIISFKDLLFGDYAVYYRCISTEQALFNFHSRLITPSGSPSPEAKASAPGLFGFHERKKYS